MKILIADDELGAPETYASLLNFLASQKGIEITCVTAKDGIEALDRIKENDFDAVLCDLEMPGANGLMVAEELRKSGSDAKFVLFTGKLLTEEEKDQIRKLNVTLLEKPFTDINELKVVLE